MGKRPKIALPSEITIKLSDPGMTIFHKVGLAGLWMTLQKFEEDKSLMRTVPTGAGWKLDDRSVTLVYGANPKTFFDWLISNSFRLDKDGLFWFPALGRPEEHAEHAVVLQEALLGTFLQHGLTRKADPSKEPTGSKSFTIDDEPHPVHYRKVFRYNHQKTDLEPGRPVKLAGWCLPGAAERHAALGETALDSSAEHALLLRYTAVGAIYFQIKTRGEGVRPMYSLVLPEITNLPQYARIRTYFLTYGIKQSLAAGSADAGMRVLVELEAAELLPDVRTGFCRVISFGTLPWSSQQKSRVHLLEVRPGSANALKTYDICRRALPPRLIRPKGKEEPFWDVSLMPDLVAQNISTGRPWYQGFADLIADKDRRKHVFSYEKGGLTNMMKDPTVLSEEPERLFVLACQEALRRHMGRKHSRPGGADWETEFEKVRVNIARCKNAATLRATITDFWSRGGTLHKGGKTLLVAGDDWWQQVLPLFDERNWRKAKDLALLALASYPSSKEQEKGVEQ